MARSSSTPAPESALFNDRAAAGLSFAAALAFLLATHFAFLNLPYHWDELGYYVPAAHDLLVSGALVPRSTLPNVHPPLVMAYLAGFWTLFGFSIPVTRVAMLVLAAATLAAAFLVARRLSGTRAAVVTLGLLAVSPLFFAQSMLAHLDLPATLGVLLALYWFLAERWWFCSLAATALVLTKETGVIVPLVLLALSRRHRERWLPLALPCVALAAWLVFLRTQTGHWFGNAEFERYNVAESLSPARAVLVLLRRLYQLGIANFHWIGLLVLWRGRRLLAASERPLAAVVAGYVVLHSLIGGAVLFRYLLPALALFYILIAPRLHGVALAALAAGLAVSNWWNPPYPFNYEDNLAVVDFVRLQQQAADWLSDHAAGRTITTAWPLTDALTNPLLGYVKQPLRVQPVENFQAGPPGKFAGRSPLLALYSRAWEPAHGWQRWPPAARLLERYFAYRPQISPDELESQFHLRPVAHWERRGQWMTIFAAPSN